MDGYLFLFSVLLNGKQKKSVSASSAPLRWVITNDQNPVGSRQGAGGSQISSQIPARGGGETMPASLVVDYAPNPNVPRLIFLKIWRKAKTPDTLQGQN